jgi:hypothetical protein
MRQVPRVIKLTQTPSGTEAGYQWLRPEILPIWEAEIKRIVIRGQP